MTFEQKVIMLNLVLLHLLLIYIRPSASNINLENFIESSERSHGNSTNQPEETTVDLPQNTDHLLELSLTNFDKSTSESNNVTCDNSLNYNLSFWDLLDLKDNIKFQLSELAKRNDTLNEIFFSFENSSQTFVYTLDRSMGEMATKLGGTYLENSTDFLQSLKKLNSFINKYDCLKENEHESFNMTPVIKYEQNFRINNFIIQEFEYIFNLTDIFTDIYYANKNANISMEEYNTLRNIDSLKSAISEIRIVKENMHELVEKLKEFHYFLGENELYQPFHTESIAYLINLDDWQDQYFSQTLDLEYKEKYLTKESFRILIQHQIQPAIQGTIFIIGFIGNVVLLIIFAKHKEMRTAASMMILNLALCDSFNLLINIPTFYFYSLSSEWTLGNSLCIAFRFGRQLGIAVSIYSVVMISIQRYLVFSNLFKTHKRVHRMSTRVSTILSILLVWIIGVAIATPHSIKAGVYENNCYGASQSHEGYTTFITSFDFALFCVIPLTFIAVLSIATACLIRGSISDMPGESVGMDKHIKTRIISSRVLISLAVVSAFSYIPYYTFFFLYSLMDFELDQSRFIVIFLVIYTLTFANCCFNPIALYIFSCNFRKYFNKYLFCRKTTLQDDLHKQSSNITTSSSLETRL